MISINVHHVKKIEIKKIEKLSISYCRDIVIHTNEGKVVEITVFSEDPKALEPKI